MANRKLEITRATLQIAAIPPAAWRPISDAEAEAAIAALAGIVGEKQATQPSMVRRLAVTKDGGAHLLTVEVPSAPYPSEWYPYQGPPGSRFVAFPLEVGAAILASELNPELELQEMRARHDAYAREQEQKRIDEQNRASEIRRNKERLEKESRECRASDWQILSGWQRFAVLLALAVEKDSPSMAASIRAVLGMNLAGSDEAFPRSPEWFAGLNLDSLDGARRAGLEGSASDERDRAIMASCPPRTRDQIALMCGSDLHAQAAQWTMIREAQHRERELQAQAEAASRPKAEARDQAEGARAVPFRIDRDAQAQRAVRVGRGVRGDE